MWGVGLFRGPGSSVTSFSSTSEQQHGRLPGHEKKEKQVVAEAGIMRELHALGVHY